MNRRSFFNTMLGTAPVLGATLAMTSPSPASDTVRHHGDYTLTWEGWRSIADVWMLAGFWRATRAGRPDAFLYSTTGGIVGFGRIGYALNYMTRDGWERLAPDTPSAICDAARQRALTQLIDALDAGEFAAQMQG